MPTLHCLLLWDWCCLVRAECQGDHSSCVGKACGTELPMPGALALLMHPGSQAVHKGSSRAAAS